MTDKKYFNLDSEGNWKLELESVKASVSTEQGVLVIRIPVTDKILSAITSNTYSNEEVVLNGSISQKVERY